MKRRISLFLALVTLLTCFSTMALPTAAEDAAAPVVWFGGHQRTVVAEDSYGIRLIGLANDLTADEVGFDVAVINNDGKMATFEEKITTVYTSVSVTVEGVETEITAAELGAKYIFTVVLTGIDPTKGFWGYLCSTYYKVGDEKVSGETNQIVYNGAERWTDYGVGERLNTTYIGYSVGMNPNGENGVDDNGREGSDDNYFILDQKSSDSIEVQLGKMWDKNYGNGYGGVKIYNGNTGAYTMAKFDNPTQIARISFVSWYHANLNVAAKVQVSANGTDWKTVYTFSSETDDTYFLTSGWSKRGISVNVDDEGFYEYIRIYADEDVSGDNGFSFSDIAVYEKVMLPGLKQVSVSSPEIKVTQDAGTNGFYGTGTDGKTEASKANLFDNNPKTSCCVGV